MSKELTEKKSVDFSKLSDFEISMLIIERDTAQFRVERIDELLNKIGEVKGFFDVKKKEGAAEPKAVISEEPFNTLKYETAKGERLGDYEVAYKKSNNTDDWQRCFNVLRANSATIKSHFSEPSWSHFYWLYLEKYDDRFFRVKRASP